MANIIEQLNNLIIMIQLPDSFNQFTELLEQQKDLDLDLNFRFYRGGTMLTNATNRGHIEYIKLLINNGADLNVIDDYGNNLLLNSSQAIARYPGQGVGAKKCYQTIEYLLELGMDPNARGLGQKN